MKTIVAIIILSFTIFSCSSGKKNMPKISTVPLDTIKAKADNNVVKPVLFETAFSNGITQRANKLDAFLYGINIGNLKVPSGRLIACDPMHMDEYGIPFTQAFPTGEFPVQLSITKVEDAETIAFARVKFSDEPVVKWELALQKGQKPYPVGGDEIHGYSIDGGVGVFIDEIASKAFLAEEAAKGDTSDIKSFEHPFFKQMEKYFRHKWKYNIYQFASYNMAAFSSGFGDGYYASYIGFDKQGKPCRLLSDFGLFNWKIDI